MKAYAHTYLDAYRGLSQPVWILAIVMLINRTGAMVLPFLGIYMTSSLGFSLKEAGWVLSCFGLGAVLGAASGGWLTDKYGPFRIQTISLFLAVPVFIALAYLRTIAVLSTGIFVLSFITEIFRPANSVSISSYAKPENITRAFSLNRMALNLGFSIGPALGGILAAISYYLLFYGNAFTVALAGIIFYRYFHKREKAKSNVSGNTPARKIAKTGVSPWLDFPFLFFSMLVCLYSICFFQLISTLPLYYKDVQHLSNKDIGLLLGFNGLVVFSLEMLLVSSSERKMKAGNIIIMGTVFCALSFLVLLLGNGLAILYAAMFLLSISEIFAMPFMATVAIYRAPKGREGAYMGLNSMAFSAAHILSPLIGTFVAARYGFNTLWVGTTVVAMAIAAGLWWVMKKMPTKTVVI